MLLPTAGGDTGRLSAFMRLPRLVVGYDLVVLGISGEVVALSERIQSAEPLPVGDP